VEIECLSSCNRILNIQFFDSYPSEHIQTGLPCFFTLKPKEIIKLSYGFRSQKRGLFTFLPAQLKWESALGFWSKKGYSGEETTVKVYPNFKEVVKFGMLAAENHLKQMGIHVMRKRGEGTDFHQLRPFHQGDSLSSINWKSSAKFQELVALDMRQEQDQQIITLLDCGNRLHIHDGAVSLFDQALNAMILLSYVALKQGDAVGYSTFSGVEKALAPKKGKKFINTILESLFDIHSTENQPDYLGTAEKILHRVKKRSLIILLTNIHEEDHTDLQVAVKLLRKKHLVIIACLKEKQLSENLNKPLINLDDSLRFAELANYDYKRSLLLKKLRFTGCYIIDTFPAELPVKLVSAYLNLKRQGAL